MQDYPKFIAIADKVVVETKKGRVEIYTAEDSWDAGLLALILNRAVKDFIHNK